MIVNDLKIDLMRARKAKDELRTSVLGFLLSDIQNKEIELRGQGESLTDEAVAAVLKRQLKKRNQSIEAYEKGNRQDLVAKETSEKELLEEIQNAYFG